MEISNILRDLPPSKRGRVNQMARTSYTRILYSQRLEIESRSPPESDRFNSCPFERKISQQDPHFQQSKLAKLRRCKSQVQLHKNTLWNSRSESCCSYLSGNIHIHISPGKVLEMLMSLKTGSNLETARVFLLDV